MLLSSECCSSVIVSQARKNREIALLQRKIDEVPSRTELTQYQRRFIELYSQGELIYCTCSVPSTGVCLLVSFLHMLIGHVYCTCLEVMSKKCFKCLIAKHVTAQLRFNVVK